MTQTSALILWGVLALIFLLIEALTPQLLSIWFSVGALVALALAAIGVQFWLQIVAFVVVSAAVLFLMRPLSEKFKKTEEAHLNANRILGRHATVVEPIDPERGTGLIRVDGAVWSAKSVDNAPIANGVRVKVHKIEGVKAVVRLSRVQPGEEEKPGE